MKELVALGIGGRLVGLGAKAGASTVDPSLRTSSPRMRLPNQNSIA